jgi:Tfp pilus assembly pilus retraction ATPase PilT
MPSLTVLTKFSMEGKHFHEKITYLVLRKSARKNHRQKLVDFVNEKKPDLLIIAWCYSTNGDVCMELRSNAILSRMIVEAEMRKIGIKDAKLNSDQVAVLKKALDSKIKDIILTGGTGSGKTIIGAEVIKIWMAQHENKILVSAPYFI